MAEFTITQEGAPDGEPGIAHTGLVAGAPIALEATSPPGATHFWEIVDAVGSNATLSATVGSEITLGDAETIVAPSTFLVQLTTTLAGVTTTTRRIAAVRSNNLRYPAYSETAPLSYTDGDHGAESSDNSYYDPLTGKVAENNWKGWIPWSFEVTNGVDDAAALFLSPTASPSLPCLRDQTIFASDGMRVIAGGVLVGDDLPANLTLRLMGRLNPGSTSHAELTLWDMGTKASPTLGSLLATCTVRANTQPDISYAERELTTDGTGGTNTIYATRRMYELRIELVDGDPSDFFKLHQAGLTLY